MRNLSWGLRIATSLYILLLVVDIGTSIECFECVHNSRKVKRRSRYVFPCSEFDGSERFIVSCPDSAFCVYQSITLTLATETISVRTMDGCTPNATDKSRLAEAWLAADGCTRVRELFSPSAVTYCFCPFDFCNREDSSARSSSKKTTHKTWSLVIAGLMTMRIPLVTTSTIFNTKNF